MATLDEVLKRLDGVQPAASGYMARCPAHNDRIPSLSLDEGKDGHILIHCFAGCETESVVRAIGLETRDLMPPVPASKQQPITYDYTDAQGTVIYQILRYPGKDFKARHPDGKGGWIYNVRGVERVLYRLPSVLEAASKNGLVVIVEGEKDADRLSSIGFTATCNTFGAGKRKWKREYNHWLVGANVVVIPDNNEVGRTHAEQIVSSLSADAIRASLLPLDGLPDGGDVSDWLAAGRTGQELRGMIDSIEGAASSGARDIKSQPASHVPLVSRRAQLMACFMTARRSYESSSHAIEWVVPGLFARGTVAQLAGPPKASGKTTFMMAVASAVLRGSQFLTHQCERGPVVYLSEQGPQTLVPNYIEPFGLGGEIGESMHILYGHDVFGFKWSEIVDVSVEKAREVGAGLLVCDTFLSVARVRDENDSASVIEALAPVSAASQKHNLAIVLVHHTRKGGGHLHDAGRGSSAFAASVDVLIGCRRPEQSSNPAIRDLEIQGRLRGLFENVSIELDCEQQTYRLLGDAGQQASDRTRLAILEALEGQEGASPIERGKLLDLCLKLDQRTSGTTFRRALDKLVADGQVVREGNGKKGSPFEYRVGRTSV